MSIYNDQDERRELAELAGVAPEPLDESPPAQVEQQVIATLRRRGLVAPPRQNLRRLATAAALLLACAGGWTARGAFPPEAAPSQPGQEFLFLMTEPNGLETDAPVDELVAEYLVWAEGLAGEGELVTARRLEDGSSTVRAGGAPDDDTASAPACEPTGFFLIRTDDRARAEALAATSPHIAYGGEIMVRQVARRAGG